MSTWFTVIVQIAVLVGAIGIPEVFLRRCGEDFWDRMAVHAATVTCWTLVMVGGWWLGGFSRLYGWAS